MCNFVYQQQREILSLSFQEYPKDIGHKEHVSTHWVDSPQDTFCNAVYSVKNPVKVKLAQKDSNENEIIKSLLGSYQNFKKVAHLKTRLNSW